jgi:Cys-rich repeat protein
MFRILLATAGLFVTLASTVQVSATETPSDAPYDHLACYKVREANQFHARVQLDSSLAELEIPPTCKLVGRSLAYCTPVRKSVEKLRYREGVAMAPYLMPGLSQPEGRICYRVRCKVEPFEGPLSVQDQFGRHALRGFALKRLCTNARLISDVTTTTTTTTTTVPQDPCALVDCAQGHYCRPECENLNAAECVPFVPEGGICDGFVEPCRQALCEPGLACLAILGAPDVPGICVDIVGDCHSDDDCIPGEVCEPSAPGGPDGNVCVPGCRDDDDCGEGEKCEEVICVTTPCPGQCIPSGEAECKVDSDCPAGEVCEPGAPFDPRPLVCAFGCHTDDQCKPGELCLAVPCITTPCPGQCVSDPPGECGECVSENDCSDGWRCTAADECLLSCACPECDVCAGHCVPKGCGGCYSDADCGEDLYCNVHEVCLTACACPACAVCAGECVPVLVLPH